MGDLNASGAANWRADPKRHQHWNDHDHHNNAQKLLHREQLDITAACFAHRNTFQQSARCAAKKCCHWIISAQAAKNPKISKKAKGYKNTETYEAHDHQGHTRHQIWCDLSADHYPDHGNKEHAKEHWKLIAAGQGIGARNRKACGGEQSAKHPGQGHPGETGHKPTEPTDCQQG